MSLDLLISKYLDGELTHEEDSSLRRLIKESRAGKDEFDAAVLINAAISDEADSIQTPPELYSQTEDIVLMQILNLYESVPLRPAVTKVPPRRRFMPAFAFMLAVAMIGGIFSVADISDYNIENSLQAESRAVSPEQLIGDGASAANIVGSSNYSEKSQTKENDTKTEAKIKADKRVNIAGNSNNIGNSNNTKKSQISEKSGLNTLGGNENFSDFNSINNTENESSSSVKTAQSFDSKLILSENKEISNNIDLNKESGNIAKSDVSTSAKDKTISFENNTSQEKSSEAKPSYGKPSEGAVAMLLETSSMPMDVNNPFAKGAFQTSGTLGDFARLDPFSSKSDVNLSTFMMNDVANPKRQLKGSKPVSGFSQSVSYKLNEKSSFGLEFGSIEYDYDFKTYVRISSSSPILSKIEVLDPTANVDMNLYLPITLNHRQQALWFSPFWDYNLFAGELLSLQSRLGAGVSGDGYLAYGRLFGKVHLYKGIFISLGGEARGFQAKLSSSKNGVISTGSIIYGLQFKF